MTSASQSNSGAAAYLGFLHALAGSPQVLTLAHLEQEALQERVRQLLTGVHRTSGSSGWLKDMMLADYGSFEAMVNYEALVIEANRELVRRGQEPLYVIYPVDGIMTADSPLAYVNKGDTAKEALFGELQKYLLSEAAQQAILALGRRTAALAFDGNLADRSVFNPDWASTYSA
jgi:Ca-activated chloride channel family protein